MIKEIEELQESVSVDFASGVKVSMLFVCARFGDILGLLHQLAVKVERLENPPSAAMRQQMAKQERVGEVIPRLSLEHQLSHAGPGVPGDSEEGGHG